MSRALCHFVITTFALLLLVASAEAEEKLETAIFAGGCFWCVESDFDHVPGVIETISGYSGGTTTQNVTYKNHADAQHREVVKITFDANRISYGELLDIYWRSVDPTDAGGQFCDRGHSYTTAIYTLTEDQANEAEASRNKLEASGVLSAAIATEIAPAKPFFEAEGYHQDYYNTNSIRYRYYRFACGRDDRVKEVWGPEAHKGIEK
ncbi:peptide-methionine (S)-S-oxide reductase MsrA [uncultured Cohaesibacter sp.]|uniref:peptide-methionine (S)-S-oxide reductase MsrA n=1 Tax=uncultured Cohaesibacter sp. TaxID=1002546 RepID=UPI0029308742|nr:peptide-methionine (S)-S-oxide reductase MsrA [uncultured Cohaesibacter sp.]